MSNAASASGSIGVVLYEGLLKAGLVGILIGGQPCGIRLRGFHRVADGPHGKVEQLRSVGAGRVVAAAHVDLAEPPPNLGDVAPGAGVLAPQLRIGLHLGEEFVLPLPLLIHELGIEQARLVTGDRLLSVLQAENRVAERHSARRIGVGQRVVGRDLTVELIELRRILDVPQIFQLGHRVEPSGRAGIADHEDQVTFP